MASISMNIRVNAPHDRVFGVFSDLDRAAEFVDQIKSCEIIAEGDAGRLGVGTRFRETREMFGKEAIEEMELVAWDPPRGYTIRGDSCGTEFLSVFVFTPTGDGGTDVAFEMTSRPYKPLAKLAAPVFGAMMKKTMTKCMRQDFDDLKAVCESRADGAPAEDVTAS